MTAMKVRIGHAQMILEETRPILESMPDSGQITPEETYLQSRVAPLASKG
jgi:hypothetical protein